MEFGMRLRLARLKAGLSLRSLSDIVGVSHTAIGNYERGEDFPRQATLVRLAKGLGIKTEFFFREVEVTLCAPAYRKHKSLPQDEQETIEAELTDYLERHVRVLSLLGSATPTSDLPRYPAASFTDVERAADSLRTYWGLGTDPLGPLSTILETHGVLVIPLRGRSRFDGYSCLADGLNPVITFNRDLPGDRQRFTIAHELAHLVLSVSEGHDEEKYAHRFAGAFLAPEAAVYADLQPRRTRIDILELYSMKLRYGLSIAAWIHRVGDLGLVGADGMARLWRQRGARKWTTEEPGEVAREEPQALSLLVNRARAEGILTSTVAAELLDQLPGPRAIPASSIDEAIDGETIEYYRSSPEPQEFVNADLQQ